MTHGDLEQRTFSFLLEVWLEPREIEGLPTILRGRARELRSNEERYVKTPAELASFIDGVLDRAGISERRWDGEEER